MSRQFRGRGYSVVEPPPSILPLNLHKYQLVDPAPHLTTVAQPMYVVCSLRRLLLLLVALTGCNPMVVQYSRAGGRVVFNVVVQAGGRRREKFLLEVGGV